MDNSTLVSVIIPVFNVEKYLSNCVNSVLNQSYANLEVILVDDGSTDNSGSLCDEFQRRDDRVKVYHKPNEGLGYTRNFGIDHASGKYIMLLDSDDYIELEMIQRMYDRAIENSADLVVEGYVKVSESGDILFKDTYSEALLTGDAVKNEFLPRMIGSLPGKKDSIFTTANAKLYCREVLNKYNLRFPSERIIQSEDLAFQLNAAPYFKRVYVSGDSGYFYRANPKSLTTIYKESRFDECIKVYKYVIEKIDSLNLPQSAKYRAAKMLFVQTKSAVFQENWKINKKSYHQSYLRIKDILDNKCLSEAISEYPVSEMSFQQRVFVLMLKYRTAFLLNALVQLKGGM